MEKINYPSNEEEKPFEKRFSTPTKFNQLKFFERSRSESI